jgi:hypothetical protein
LSSFDGIGIFFSSVGFVLMKMKKENKEKKRPMFFKENIFINNNKKKTLTE